MAFGFYYAESRAGDSAETKKTIDTQGLIDRLILYDGNLIKIEMKDIIAPYFEICNSHFLKTENDYFFIVEMNYLCSHKLLAEVLIEFTSNSFKKNRNRIWGFISPINLLTMHRDEIGYKRKKDFINEFYSNILKVNNGKYPSFYFDNDFFIDMGFDLYYECYLGINKQDKIILPKKYWLIIQLEPKESDLFSNNFFRSLKLDKTLSEGIRMKFEFHYAMGDIYSRKRRIAIGQSSFNLLVDEEFNSINMTQLVSFHLDTIEIKKLNTLNLFIGGLKRTIRDVYSLIFN